MKHSVSDMRKAMEMAQQFVKLGVMFIPVPVTSEEEKVELGLRAMANIDLLESKEQQK